MKFVVYIMIFLAFFPINYMNFYVILSDDVEIYAGKKALRNQRRKQKGFWKKFLFLDFCWAVEKWHYVFFWVFLISYPIVALSSALLTISDNAILRILKLGTGLPCLFVSAVSAFSRFPLYWLKVHQRPQKRSKIRKSGKNQANSASSCIFCHSSILNKTIAKVRFLHSGRARSKGDLEKRRSVRRCGGFCGSWHRYLIGVGALAVLHCVFVLDLRGILKGRED